MALPDKTRTLFGVLLGLEGSYADGTTNLVNTTHGVELKDMIPVPGTDWIYNGDRPRPDGTAGSRRRLAPQGPEHSIPIDVEAKGRASAFAGSSDVAPDLDVGLRISGHSRTFSTNKQIYAPVNSGFASGKAELYFISEKWTMIGCFADFVWEGEAGEPANISFPLRGIRTSAIATSALPTITYPVQDVDPPPVINTQFSINSYSALLRRFRFQKNITIGRRRNGGGTGGTGHGGLTISTRRPILHVEFEAPLLSAFNPYSLMEAATQMPVSIQVGSVAGNIQYGSFPLCQIIPASFQINEEDEVAQYSFDLQVNPSTPTANDDYVFETR